MLCQFGARVVFFLFNTPSKHHLLVAIAVNW